MAATDQMKVAWWLRAKAEQSDDTQDFRRLLLILTDYSEPTPDDVGRLRALLRQLDADAAHSDLLRRLFDGGDVR